MITFETSDTTAKLDAALAEAQGHIEAALKEKENEAFKRGGKASKYADLNAVWTAARPALAAAKIAVTQWPVHSEDGRLHMVTRIAHEGEWMRAEFSIPVTNPNAHGYGGAITYARRFCFAAAVGVVTDEDDDGNAASSKPANGNGNGHHDLTGNERVKGYKPPATANSQAANDARAAAEYYKRIEREIDEIKSERDLDDWYATNRDEMNARLAQSYVPTVRDKIELKREEFAMAGAPA